MPCVLNNIHFEELTTPAIPGMPLPSQRGEGGGGGGEGERERERGRVVCDL